MCFVFIIVLLWSVGRYADLLPFAVSGSSPWYTSLTYSFIHLSFLHLLTNAVVFLLWWRVLKSFHTNPRVTIPVIAAAAALAPLFASGALPTVGASGVIFAMMGVYIVLLIPHRLCVAFRCLLSLLLFSILQALINPSVNWRIHLSAFLFAVLLYFPVRLIHHEKP